MRIISGTHGGRVINPPKNLRARPTTDFAKENIFNVLSNIVDFQQCDVLDLFAGTGSISYEFASRGVKSVTSVELNAVHHNFIKSTASGFGFRNLFPVKANAFFYLKSCTRKFDIVFSDAPYDLEGADKIIGQVLDGRVLNQDGLLIFEHPKGQDYSSHPNFLQQRNYGSVCFALFSAEKTGDM